MIKNSVRPVVSAVAKQSARDDRIKKTFVTFDPVLSSYCELGTAFAPSGDFEIEVIIYVPDSISTSTTYGIVATGSGDNIIYARDDTGSAPSVRWQVPRTSGNSYPAVDIEYNKLTHIKVWRDGDDFYIKNLDSEDTTSVIGATDYDGEPFNYVGRWNTGDYFDGIISSVKLTDLATPSNSQHYALNRITGNTETSLINSGLITYNNITDSDREVFSWDAANDYWVGENELVNNGGFDTDSDWTKGTGWSIAGGKAIYDGDIGGVALLYQEVSRPSQYLVDISLSVMDGNGLQFYDGASYSTNLTNTGNHKLVETNADTSYGFFTMRASSEDNDIAIDRVSLKRVLQVA